MTYPISFNTDLKLTSPKLFSAGKPDAQEDAAPEKSQDEPIKQPFHRSVFFAANNTLHNSEIQFGALPVNNETGRLLLSGFVVEQRASDPISFWDIDHQRMSYIFEPQYQLHLAQDWEMYFRAPLKINGQTTDSPSTMDILTDVTVGYKWSDFLFRFEYGANNITDAASTSHFLTLTPYVRLHLHEDRIMLRIGAKYTHNFQTEPADALTIETKLEGTIKSDPWSGWGVQFFTPLLFSPNLPEGAKRFDLAGVYAWGGTVLPPNWLGRGWFFEGGIWIGGQINESEHPGQDLVAGINLKIKYGTEARWWQ